MVMDNGITRLYDTLLLLSPLLIANLSETEPSDWLIVSLLIVAFTVFHFAVRYIRRRKQLAALLDNITLDYARYATLVGADSKEVGEQIRELRSLLGFERGENRDDKK